MILHWISEKDLRRGPIGELFVADDVNTFTREELQRNSMLKTPNKRTSITQQETTGRAHTTPASEHTILKCFAIRERLGAVYSASSELLSHALERSSSAVTFMYCAETSIDSCWATFLGDKSCDQVVKNNDTVNRHDIKRPFPPPPPSLYLSIYLSIYLSLYLYLFLSISISIYLSLSQNNPLFETSLTLVIVSLISQNLSILSLQRTSLSLKRLLALRSQV